MFKIISLLLIVSASISLHASETDWQLQKDHNGIQVYTKDVKLASSKGDVTSALKAFRGVTLINASMDHILNTMRDVENFDQWLHNCYEPRIVETRENDTRIVYQKTRTPWPTDDRDSVLEQSLVQQGSAYVLEMKTTSHPAIDTVDGYVRVPYFNGILKFTPVSDTQLEVIYEAAFDSGGNVPSFVSNLFILDTPYYSLDNLRNYLQ